MREIFRKFKQEADDKLRKVKNKVTGKHVLVSAHDLIEAINDFGDLKNMNSENNPFDKLLESSNAKLLSENSGDLPKKQNLVYILHLLTGKEKLNGNIKEYTLCVARVLFVSLITNNQSSIKNNGLYSVIVYCVAILLSYDDIVNRRYVVKVKFDKQGFGKQKAKFFQIITKYGLGNEKGNINQIFAKAYDEWEETKKIVSRDSLTKKQYKIAKKIIKTGIENDMPYKVNASFSRFAKYEYIADFYELDSGTGEYKLNLKALIQKLLEKVPHKDFASNLESLLTRDGLTIKNLEEVCFPKKFKENLWTPFCEKLKTCNTLISGLRETLKTWEVESIDNAKEIASKIMSGCLKAGLFNTYEYINGIISSNYDLVAYKNNQQIVEKEVGKINLDTINDRLLAMRKLIT